MFVTGPDVVRTVTHEDVSFETLGGAMVHNPRVVLLILRRTAKKRRSTHCGPFCRFCLKTMPKTRRARATADSPLRADEELDDLVPENPNKAYDMKEVIKRIVDDGEFFEVQEHFAGNIIIGFARMNGRVVGIVGQQPMVLAGVLDINASVKGARFVRFCDCFNIPILTLEDVPGFLPGVGQEHGGVIRHGAKLLYAYCEATVPKITIITRKSYGGAYCVMNCKHIRGDLNLAWPTAEIAVMGPEGAVNIIFREEIALSSDPDATRVNA